jgi:hypothetical protein
MLEEAILEATTLREAALKNAEAVVIEKYSGVIKEAVEKILEQEAAPQATQPAADPIAAVMGGAGAQADLGLGTAGTDTKNKLKGVPVSFTSKGPEMVEINFDELEAKEEDDSEEELSLDASDEEEDTSSDEEEQTDLEQEGYDDVLSLQEGEELELEESSHEDIEEEELEEELELEGLDSVRPQKPSEMEEAASCGYEEEEEEEELEETIDLEEAIESLEEEIMVDMQPVKTGQFGLNSLEARKQHDVALAMQADDIVKVEKEKYKKVVKDLQESLEESRNNYKKVVSENKELYNIVEALKESLEKTNVLNAKLLYTNKVFENASLNERQKQTIVESISKAKTLDEAKTIYDTLQSTVDGSKKVAPKSLSEALFENAPFISRPRTNNNSNVDMLTERMKKLAGIKRSN